MLVDHGVGAGVHIGVGDHVLVQLLAGGGDIALPQRLVVQEHQGLKVDGQQILLAVQLTGLYGHGQLVGQQRVGVQNVRQRRKNVHGHEGAQHIVRIEVHVRAIGGVAAVELELVGHIGLLLEMDGDAVVCQGGVDLVGDGLHDGLAAVMPDVHRHRALGGLRLCAEGGVHSQQAEAHGQYQQQCGCFFHFGCSPFDRSIFFFPIRKAFYYTTAFKISNYLAKFLGLLYNLIGL